MTAKTLNVTLKQHKSKLMVTNLYPGVAYDPLSGYLYRLKRKDGSLGRRIIPVDGLVIYNCAVTGKRVKKNAAILAWEIYHDKRMEGGDIVMRDSNPENTKIANIQFVKRETVQFIMDAMYNMQKAEMKKHETDAHKYVVVYRKGNRLRRKSFCDVVSASCFLRELAVIASKQLNSFYVST